MAMGWIALGTAAVSAYESNKAAGKQSAAIQAGAETSANAQLEGQRVATEEQRRQFNLTRGDTATQRRVGDTSLNYLNQLLIPGQQQSPQAFGGGSQPMPTPMVGNTPPAGGGGLYTPSGGGGGWGKGLTGVVRGVRDTFQSQQAPTTFAGTAEYAPQKFEMGDFTADPGYQFRLEQGANARTNALGAGGLKLSGRAQKELERYGQDYGSAEYGNVYARRMGEFQQTEQDKQNYLANLSRLAGYGAQGIATSSSAGANAANQIGGAAMNAGTNLGNIYSGAAANQANVTGQNYANINNSIQSGVGNYLAYRQNQNMNNMFMSQPSAYSSGDAYGPSAAYYGRQ